MNERNLIPIRSESEARALGKKGGEASGRARRKQKEMREWAKIIGSLPTKVVGPDGKPLKGATLDADVVMQQYRAAHNGNTKAAKFIAKINGQWEDKVAVSSDQPIIVVNSQSEKEELEKLGELTI